MAAKAGMALEDGSVYHGRHFSTANYGQYALISVLFATFISQYDIAICSIIINGLFQN